MVNNVNNESVVNNREIRRGTAALLIACGCLIYAVSGGLRASFGMLVNPVVDATGLDYAAVSLAAGVMQLMYGVTQPVWGTVALKRSNFFVLTVGIPLLAVGLIATPLCHSSVLLIFFLGILFGSGSGALCFGMIMGALSPILGQKRAASASGILNASSGIGGSAFAPVMQALNQAVGIRMTMIILAVPIVILLPIVLLIGQKAKEYSENSVDAEDNESKRSAVEIFREAFKSPDYRALMIGFGTCGFHMCIIQTHFVTQMTHYGISEQTAAMVYTAYGLFSMAGSIFSGVLCSKLHLKTVLGSLYGTRVLIVAFMLLMPKTIMPTCIVAFVLGLTGDATVTPTSEIISRRYGPHIMALLFGITFVGHQIGGFISSWLGGIFISASGNFVTIWLIDIALCALASFFSYRIRVKDGE